MPTLGKKIIRSPNNGNPMVVAVAADAVPSFGNIATNTTQQQSTQPQSDTQQTTEQQTEQPQTPQQNTQAQSTTPATHKKKTNVDGKGMWRHWKRNFKNKLLALLDLIDNSLDAAVVINSGANNDTGDEESSRDFIGRVHIYPDEVDNSNGSIQSVMNNVTSSNNNSESSNSGLVIVNNSYKPIQSMEYCLGAYNSSKVDSGSSDIGENGVGLKQGCATLSNLSFVLIKNGAEGYVELGIIAESLQTIEGPYLPSFKFSIPNNDEDISSSIHEQMKTLFTNDNYTHEAQCIKQYGSSISSGRGGSGSSSKFDLERGIDRLCHHYHSILNFFDNEHVFGVILNEMILIDPIKDLQEMIPRTYLHIPNDFDFRIGSPSRYNNSINKMIFQYWPQRLVELSSFTVKIDKAVPFHKMQEVLNTPTKHAYKLRVFCGFDRMRINESIYTEKAASLYIYSRQSGRLITYEEDGRNSLGMTNGSSKFCQGLTIIIDDIEGKLPLNPTKQELAFGEQEDGEVHEVNMKAWISCVSKFYYDYHFAKFNNSKAAVTNKVKAFGSEELPPETLKGIDTAHLTTFEPKYKVYGRVKKSIIIDKRKAVSIITGKDTHFKLLPDPPPPPPPPPPIVNPASAHAAQQPFRFQPIVNTGGSKKRRVEQPQPPPVHGGDMQVLVGNNVQIAQQVLGQLPPVPQLGLGRNPQAQLQQEQNAEMMDPLLQMNLHSLQRPRRQQPSGTTAGQPSSQSATSAETSPASGNKHSVSIDSGTTTGQPSSQSATRTEASTNQQQGTAPALANSDKQAVSVDNSETSSKKVDTTKDGIEIIDLAADSGAEDDAIPPTNNAAQGSTSNVKEEEPNATAAASNDNDDMDEDSVSSTKDYYKDFCTQLTAKLVVKNEACSKMRKENKQLKKEMKRVKSDHEKAMKKAEEKVQKLRKEIEKLRLDSARSVTE